MTENRSYQFSHGRANWRLEIFPVSSVRHKAEKGRRNSFGHPRAKTVSELPSHSRRPKNPREKEAKGSSVAKHIFGSFDPSALLRNAEEKLRSPSRTEGQRKRGLSRECRCTQKVTDMNGLASVPHHVELLLDPWPKSSDCVLALLSEIIF